MPRQFVTGNTHSECLMAEKDAAYMAGFLDGEGTIGICKARRKESRAGFRYQAYMSLANTNLAVLVRLRDVCGNGRLSLSYTAAHPNHKVGYVLRFVPGQLRHLLPQLLPYLQVKRQQAEVVLAFLALAKVGRNLNDQEWQRAEELYARIRTLNRRGTDEVFDPALLELPPVKPRPGRPDPYTKDERGRWATKVQ